MNLVDMDDRELNRQWSIANRMASDYYKKKKDIEDEMNRRLEKDMEANRE